MNLRTNIPILLLCSFGFLCQSTNAQNEINNPVSILNAKSQKLDASSDTIVRYLFGNVVFEVDSTYFYTDTAAMTDFKIELFGNVVVMRGDSIQIFSNSLIYIRDSSLLYFVGKEYDDVVFQDKDHQLFTNRLVYDIDREVASYTTGGVLVSPFCMLESNLGIFYVQTQNAYFSGDVKVVGNEFKANIDSLKYNINHSIATFIAPVLVTTSDGQIESKGGYFNFEEDKASFNEDAKYSSSGDTSKADVIFYDGNSKFISLRGNASTVGETSSSKADTINIYEAEKTYLLIGDAYHSDSTSELSGNKIVFDKIKSSVNVIGQSIIKRDEYIINAADIDINDNKEIATARGNVIWEDTVNKYTIYADFGLMNQKKATTKTHNLLGQPVLDIKIDNKNSIRVAGDTLQGKELVEDQFTFFAHQKVSMIYNDIAATCDSMIFNKDIGLIELYHNPYMWYDSLQFSADTIICTLDSNNRIKSIDLHSHVIIITTSNDIVYDQMSGHTASAVFRNDTIRKMIVTKNCKSLYYVEDKLGHYLGENKSNSEEIIIEFKNNNIHKIRYSPHSNHIFTPMSKTDYNKSRLEGFNWRLDRKPTEISIPQ